MTINQTISGSITFVSGQVTVTATIPAVVVAKAQLQSMGTQYTSNTISGRSHEARLSLLNTTTVQADWNTSVSNSSSPVAGYVVTEWT